MNGPIRKVMIAVAVLFAAMFVNLNVVQVLQGSKYRNDSQNSRVLLNEYASPRGPIVVDGSNIAYSKVTSDELKYQRVYANGPEYAPVTGYYSYIYNSYGLEGVEDSVLSGDSPKLFTSQLANLLTGRGPRGGSVQLSLNKDAQDAAYKAMRLPDGSYKRGAVVALNPTNGAILAMVSTPSYDPNKLADHNSDVVTKAYDDYRKDKSQPMLNRAIRQIYPAGSIFKIIDSAAALKLGVTSATSIAAPSSYWPYQPTRTSPCPADLAAACVENFAAEQCDNGKTATLTFAFAKSCNTAFAELAVRKIGAARLGAQARLFGLDRDPAAIPLTVAPSTIGSPTELAKDPAALAQTSFGQRNVRVSPLQAAMLASAVADNGTLWQPFLVRSELRPNLSVLSKTTPTQLSQVISPDLDTQLVSMMEAVVSSREGTGASAAITGLNAPGRSVVVGGKTGTADVGETSASKEAPDAWFTGFAMVNNSPKIAVAVIIENGGVQGDEVTGGKAAGPVAKAVMTAYLKSIGV